MKLVRYEEESIDSKAGHIPGTINTFWKDVLDQSGRWKSTEVLREPYEGIDNRGGTLYSVFHIHLPDLPSWWHIYSVFIYILATTFIFKPNLDFVAYLYFHSK